MKCPENNCRNDLRLVEHSQGLFGGIMGFSYSNDCPTCDFQTTKFPSKESIDKCFEDTLKEKRPPFNPDKIPL